MCHRGFYVLSWQWILTGYWQLAGTWAYETVQPTALNKLDTYNLKQTVECTQSSVLKAWEFGMLHISHSAVSQRSSWISKIFPLKTEQRRHANGMKYNNFVNKEMLYQFIQKKSNKTQQCIKILLFHIYMKLNMFRATRRPSSGA